MHFFTKFFGVKIIDAKKFASRPHSIYAENIRFNSLVGRKQGPLITPADIKAYRHRELAQIAKERGVNGWHSMKKAELVAALLKLARPESKRPLRSRPQRPSKQMVNVQKRIERKQQDRERQHDLSSASAAEGDDRILLMVRDPYWLQVTWEISTRSIERAHAALAEHWHSAVPVLRLSQIADYHASSQPESIIKVVPIHGGVHCWYLEAPNPPSSFRVEIGYLVRDGRFHGLARSNLVTTPPPGASEVLDQAMLDVAQNSEKIFAMSGGHDPDMNHAELREWLESRLHRPLGGPTVGRFGAGGGISAGKPKKFAVSVDAEMIVFGSTEPEAYVTIAGEPVKLQPDGSFSARVPLPERRQIVPINAKSRNGLEERIIVLAVERNTKMLEPRRHEPGDNS